MISLRILRRILDSIDPNFIMNLDIWKNLQLRRKDETLEMRKEALFPLISSFFSDLSNHDAPGAAHQQKIPKLYEPRDTFYLEVQEGLGCWAHVLGVILGFRLHPSINKESWVISLLTSFQIPPSSPNAYENIEPTWLCSNEGTDLDFNAIRAAFGIPEIDTYKLVPPESTFKFDGLPPATFNPFLQSLGSNYYQKGLSNLKAHFLFTSMNNPNLDAPREKDPYLGAQHLGETEITSEQEVFQAFINYGCNIIVLSHRLQPGSELLHYAIFWKCDITKEVLFFDPKFPFVKPSTRTSSIICNGYSMVNVDDVNKGRRSLLFEGPYRCGFFFQVQQNSFGAVHQSLVEEVVSNMNQRIHFILEHYFQLDQFSKDTFIKLDKDIVYGNSIKWSNRKLVVSRSTLRSIHTGNSVGYGVRTKTALSCNEAIGEFIGRVVVLLKEEMDAITKRQSTTQFYMLALNLNTEMKKFYRLQNGQDYDSTKEYTAYLDCSESARRGLCLVSYANSPLNTYLFNGASAPEANATISIRYGKTTGLLSASKPLPVGTEIIWKYGKGMTLPRTILEEKFSKFHPEDFPDEWNNYPFKRADIVAYLECNDMQSHPRYNSAVQYLADAITDTVVVSEPPYYYTYGNMNLTKRQFANHRLVPPVIPVRCNFTQMNYVLFFYVRFI